MSLEGLRILTISTKYQAVKTTGKADQCDQCAFQTRRPCPSVDCVSIIWKALEEHQHETIYKDTEESL